MKSLPAKIDGVTQKSIASLTRAFTGISRWSRRDDAADGGAPMPQPVTEARQGPFKTVNTMDLTPDDVVIAVMGPTGSGKSTFICSASGRDTSGIGHALKSFTDKVSAIRFWDQASRRSVVLVDTPGFDDTSKSDLDILNMISDWLVSSYNKKKLLSGILYLHRITDNRMAGTPLKNLRLFRKLCGKDALDSVYLTTTMWDEVEPGVGEKRLDQLMTEYWKTMIDQGAHVARCRSDDDSANRLIRHIIHHERSKRNDVAPEGMPTPQPPAGVSRLHLLGAEQQPQMDRGPAQTDLAPEVVGKTLKTKVVEAGDTLEATMDPTGSVPENLPEVLNHEKSGRNDVAPDGMPTPQPSADASSLHPSDAEQQPQIDKGSAQTDPPEEPEKTLNTNVEADDIVEAATGPIGSTQENPPEVLNHKKSGRNEVAPERVSTPQPPAEVGHPLDVVQQPQTDIGPAQTDPTPEIVRETPNTKDVEVDDTAEVIRGATSSARKSSPEVLNHEKLKRGDVTPAGMPIPQPSAEANHLHLADAEQQPWTDKGPAQTDPAREIVETTLNTNVKVDDIVEATIGPTGFAQESPLKVLLIQEEMVELKKELKATAAGQQLYSQLETLVEKQMALLRRIDKERKAASDAEILKELQKEYTELRTQIDDKLGQMQELKLSWFKRFFSRRRD